MISAQAKTQSSPDLEPNDHILLTLIDPDKSTQLRSAPLNQKFVNELAEAINDGAELKPIEIFWDEDREIYYIGDGHHRYAAHQQAAMIDISANVHQGGLRAAILWAAQSNVEHGLRRTNADKQKAVATLLQDSEWGKWSNRQIAAATKTSDRFVGNLRKQLGLEQEERTYTRNGQVQKMKVGDLAAPSTKKPKAKDDELMQEVRDRFSQIGGSVLINSKGKKGFVVEAPVGPPFPVHFPSAAAALQWWDDRQANLAAIAQRHGKSISSPAPLAAEMAITRNPDFASCLNCKRSQESHEGAGEEEIWCWQKSMAVGVARASDTASQCRHWFIKEEEVKTHEVVSVQISADKATKATAIAQQQGLESLDQLINQIIDQLIGESVN
ncbi:MAG TPA: hypothetical protein V6C65_21995 [Allocoleopsis sp.]